MIDIKNTKLRVNGPQLFVFTQKAFDNSGIFCETEIFFDSYVLDGSKVKLYGQFDGQPVIRGALTLTDYHLNQVIWLMKDLAVPVRAESGSELEQGA